MTYVATFFSHYGAVLFMRRLQAAGIAGTMMPVPRRVSSSCGTGVQFETDADVARFAGDDVDKIFRMEAEAYTVAYENAEA